MTLLFKTATQICGGLSLEKSFQRALHVLQKQMPVDGIYSDIFLKDAQKLQFLAHADHRQAQRLTLEVEIPQDLARTLDDPQRPQIFRVADLQEDPITAYSALKLVPKMRSFLLMRMALDQQHLGVVILYSHQRSAFDANHQAILEQLHDPFALATANALALFSEKKNPAMGHAVIDASKYHFAAANIAANHVTMVGAEHGLAKVMQKIVQVARHDVTVLIQGETGSGKEMVANALHSRSGREGRPFIKVNCGAIPETLFDSELFGHERGAFTDAKEVHQGYFEQAHQGTLFLDEISELPLSGQVRLLRVLQNKEITRVGGRRAIPLDVRVVAATHRDLRAMVREGSFREDLWYRLNVFPIDVPPLRERGEDIPELVQYFLDKLQRKYAVRQPFHLSKTSLAWMQKYAWPGNVRELENILERAVLQNMCEADRHAAIELPTLGDVCDVNAFPGKERPSSHSGHDEKNGTLEDAVRRYLKALLRESGGRIDGKGGAAEIAGLPPSTLRSKIKKIGLVDDEHHEGEQSSGHRFLM